MTQSCQLTSLLSRCQLLLAALIILLINASCSAKTQLKLPDTQPRDKLLAETLLDPDYLPNSPVHNGYFMPRADAGPALHNFNGRLRVDEFVMQDSISNGTPRSENGRFFPGFSSEFFTYDDYLVPVNREIVPSTGDRSRWMLILSPGKVWSESGDAGLSRAAFPFVMTSRTNNEAHNGLATFLYDDTQVSQFYFQITQETAAWNCNDYWGQTVPAYTPGLIVGEAALQAQFAAELAAQIPIRPWFSCQNMLLKSIYHTATSQLPHY